MSIERLERCSSRRRRARRLTRPRGRSLVQGLGALWFGALCALCFPGGPLRAQPRPELDRDQDGLTDAEERLLRTDPDAADSDGDGLLDGWEVNGRDLMAAREPLPEFGAHPLVQDVFVEIDWMRDEEGDPTPGALVAYRAAIDIDRLFRSSGTGIRVHFDIGDIESWLAPEFLEDDTPNFARFAREDASEHVLPYRARFPLRPDCDRALPLAENLYGTYYSPRYFRPTRRNLFYYLVIAEQADEEPGGRPGQSDSFQDESARLRGLRPAGVQVGVIYRRTIAERNDSRESARRARYNYAATVLHELGHAFGLGHGGAEIDGSWDNENYKPNYLSVMNWRYQFLGVDSIGGFRVLDFSDGRRIDLIESRLSEAHGFGGFVPGRHLLEHFQVEHLASDSAPFNVDWNRNGEIDIDTVFEDLNRDGLLRDRPFRDHDDWGHFLARGFPGIGRNRGLNGNSHSGCVASCPDGHELTRYLGDFNFDGLSDVLLFTGRGMALALRGRDRELRIPPNRAYAGAIGDWTFSYDDTVRVGRFGQSALARVFLVREGRAALVDFNFQGAELLWQDSELRADEVFEGEGPQGENPDGPLWSFRGEDRVHSAVLFGEGGESLLIEGEQGAVVLGFDEAQPRVDWQSTQSLRELCGGEEAWVRPGRRAPLAGAGAGPPEPEPPAEGRPTSLLIRSATSLAELDGRSGTLAYRRHSGDGRLAGGLDAAGDRLPSWTLRPTDCLYPVDLDGDGDDELYLRRADRHALLNDDPATGRLEVIWDSSRDERSALFLGFTRQAFTGDFSPTRAGEEIVLLLSTGRPERPTLWWAFGWNAETRALEQLVDPTDPTSPDRSVEATVLTGDFLGTGRELFVLRDPARLTVVALTRGGFRELSVFEGRVDQWSLAQGDHYLVGLGPAGGAEELFARRGDLLAVMEFRDHQPLSQVHRFDTSNLTLEPGPVFLRGDANGDLEVDLSDAVRELIFLFQGGTTIPCRDAADTDDSGELDISDAIRLLNFLFNGGPIVPIPGAVRFGTDPTPDDLDCQTPSVPRG